MEGMQGEHHRRRMSVKQCELYVEEILKEPQAKTLYDSIQQRMKFSVECCDCRKMDGMANSFARAFFSAAHLEDKTSQQKPSVVLCANALPDRAQIKEALEHEMVHAYDHCVARRDLTECKALACSEVRAAREAECRDNFNGGVGELCKMAGVNPFENRLKEDDTMNSVCRWFKKRCAMQNAIKSVDAVFPGKGKDCVAATLEKCYSDLHPFQEEAREE